MTKWKPTLSQIQWYLTKSKLSLFGKPLESQQ